MTDLLKILPLCFVMVAGPQIISAVFLATSENWRRNSAAYVAGVTITVPVFVSLGYLVAKFLKSGSSPAGFTSGKTIDLIIIVLLSAAAFHVFVTREESEPPKWMGKLQTATPKFSFVLGLLLLGIFPTDVLTSTSVGAFLARNGDPLWQAVPFILLTVLIIALPALAVLTLGDRAQARLPKVRDWMNDNSWIISEAVILFFVALQIENLAG